MAIALYRLGRWCAAHAKAVIAGWIVLLIALGGLAAAFMTPLTSEVKISGTKFMEVMDTLSEEIPDASGGVGTVVLEAEDGTFDEAEIAAAREVFAEWDTIESVTEVNDPFDAREQLNESRAELADGREQLEAGREQLDAAKEQLDAGQEQLDQGEAQVAQLEQAAPGSPQLAAAKAQVEAAREQLAPAREQYEQGLAELEENEAQLLAGEKLAEAMGDVQFVSDDERFAIVQIQFDVDPRSLTPEVREQIPESAQGLADEGVLAEYSMEITQEISLVGPGEIIGLVVAAVVLFIMLGSLIAAGLPLLSALIGVGVGLAGALASTALFEMNSVTPALALMLGLAVGIDYTLFIVNRHRAQILGGTPVHASIGRAIGTSGNAVIFAGMTVIIALAALFTSGLRLLAEMGFVAAGTVAAAVLVSVTLTPAVLALMGTRVVSKREWRKHGFATPGGESTERHDDGIAEEEHGGWYVNLATKYPWLTVLGIVGLVAIVAIPVADLRLGLPDGGNEPSDSSAYATYTTIAEQFGPGLNGPIVAMAQLDDPSTDELTTQADIAAQLADVEGIENVVPFGVSDDMVTFAFQLVPSTGPADAATVETTDRLFAASPAIGDTVGGEIGYAGQTIANIEISEKLSDALPGYLAVVVGLSLIILLLVFRSVVVPLVATAGFLLSIAAAFGAIVAVYQWGWLGSIFGVSNPGPIMSFAPIIIIGVLFGLAMDYQMFLVSGMREAYSHGEPARKAVKTGFTHGAKVVTAAAIIMFSVFGGFVFAHLTMVRPIGFGLAVGVLVDAVLVRMTLTPAIMHILGEKAWWIPKALDKALPDLDVEGAQLAKRLEAEHAADETDKVPTPK